MKTSQVIKALQRKKRKLRTECLKVMERYGAKGVEVAKQYSSGTLSSVMLAKLCHPYGRRSVLQAVNPEVINAQSGMFRAFWDWRIISRGDSLTLQVVNDSPHAGFLDKGTKNMVSRPIRQAVLKKLQRPYRKAVQNAVRRALKA